jgi:hypothetical protein
MAKGKSKKPSKSRAVAPVSVAKRTKTAAPRGVRKHLRQLERQLSDAARQERKRLRKLERATFRRQMLQAALEELRGETAVEVAPPAQEARANVGVTAPAKPLPAIKPRPAAVRARTTRPATPAAKTAPAATPAAKPRPAAVRTRTTRPATPAAKTAPKATD